MAAHLVNAIARAIANTPADIAKRLNLGTSESAELPRAFSGRVLAWALLVCLETMIPAASGSRGSSDVHPHMPSSPTFDHCPRPFLGKHVLGHRRETARRILRPRRLCIFQTSSHVRSPCELLWCEPVLARPMPPSIDQERHLTYRSGCTFIRGELGDSPIRE